MSLGSRRAPDEQFDDVERILEDNIPGFWDGLSESMKESIRILASGKTVNRNGEIVEDGAEYLAADTGFTDDGSEGDNNFEQDESPEGYGQPR
jgi:hypothetical protein